MAGYNKGAIVPSSVQQMVDSRGRITPPWQRFLNALVSQPQGIVAVTPTASPFSFTAGQAGSLVLSGGSVSARTLTRSGVTIPSGSSLLPMANGDTVTITYSVAPTINFVPG